jgi:hypothetical protein
MAEFREHRKLDAWEFVIFCLGSQTLPSLLSLLGTYYTKHLWEGHERKTMFYNGW